MFVGIRFRGNSISGIPEFLHFHEHVKLNLFTFVGWTDLGDNCAAKCHLLPESKPSIQQPACHVGIPFCHPCISCLKFSEALPCDVSAVILTLRSPPGWPAGVHAQSCALWLPSTCIPSEHQQRQQAQKEHVVGFATTCVSSGSSTCSANDLGRMAGRWALWAQEGQRGVTCMGTSAPTLSMPNCLVV